MEKREYITNSFEETRDLGRQLAHTLQGGEIICLNGELGAGKTTFTQGLLEQLGAPGPYTSPTFLIMKEYELESLNKLQTKNQKPKTIYHIDAYRIQSEDLINLGWDEILGNKNNIIIIEWPERIRKNIPPEGIEIRFEWIAENQRRISFM